MEKLRAQIGNITLLVAVLSVIAVAIMMLGARFNLWLPIVGFGLVRQYMNPLGYAVLALGALGFLYHLFSANRAGMVKPVLATLIGIGILSPMIIGNISPAPRMPPIHDITTNIQTPPEFLVLDDTREGARNSLVYGGPEVAAMQQQAYPDIAPIMVSTTPEQAFQKALSVAKGMNWSIVAEDSQAYRFEASAKTSLYQFVDDVVVVVTPTENQVRVDIRSVSRIGRSDRGVNAARIRAFVSAFNQG